MVDAVSIFLNLLKFDLWPKMWSILENILCTIEIRVYSSALNSMSWRYQWDPSHLKYHLIHISLLIFCFDDLSIGVNQVLKFPTVIVLLSISPLSLFNSVQSRPTLCKPMNCRYTRPPCPSPTHGVHPNPCPLCQWYHPTILSSVIPFSSFLQSFPASGSFPVIWLFKSF